MKKNIVAFLVLVLLPAVSFATADAPAPASSVTVAPAKEPSATSSPPASDATKIAGGRVYVVSGNVFVARGKNPKAPVAKTEHVASDTIISTDEKSAALVKFDDGQTVTLKANSAFHVQNYQYDPKKIEDSNVVFSMLAGGMRFVTGLIGQHNKSAFRLKTSTATIGIRGTEFMTTMVGDSVYSQVLAGAIDLENAAGLVPLEAGQTALVSSANTLAAVVSAAAIPPGTFEELLSLPVEPPAVSPAQSPPAQSPPERQSQPEQQAPPAESSSMPSIDAPIVAPTVAAPAIGIVGGAVSATLGLLGGGDSDSKPDEKSDAKQGAKSETTSEKKPEIKPEEKQAQPDAAVVAPEKKLTEKELKELRKAEKKKKKKDKKEAKKEKKRQEQMKQNSAPGFLQAQ